MGMPKKIWAYKLRMDAGVYQNVWEDSLDRVPHPRDSTSFIRGNIFEAELRRCRTKTLRDIAQEVDIVGSSSPNPDDWYNFGNELRRMAEEAERE